MNYAAMMRMSQRLGRLQTPAPDVDQVEELTLPSRLLQHGVQSATVDELHRVVVNALFGADGEHGDDVGVMAVQSMQDSQESWRGSESSQSHADRWPAHNRVCVRSPAGAVALAAAWPACRREACLKVMDTARIRQQRICGDAPLAEPFAFCYDDRMF